MNGEERKKAYLRDMKSTSASLKFMQFNYDMQYILLLTHVSKQTKVYSKKVIVSKGKSYLLYPWLLVNLMMKRN